MDLQRRASSQLHADIICTDDALAQFSQLLDSSFKVPQGMHFLDDFPIWDAKFGVFPLVRIGVFHGKELVASTAVRLAAVHSTKQASIPVALIGAVATAPKWRGMGVATHAVSLAVEWAIEKRASACLLWGSEHRFYQRLGFVLCGQQCQIPLYEVELPSTSDISIHRGWSETLFKLIQSRSGGLVLSDKDRGWFKSHKNVDWFYAGSKDDPKAYVAINRGIDLHGYIHEWGGDPVFLSALFFQLRSENPNLVLLCSPEHISQFTPRAVRSEPLFMAKILNPAQLIGGFYPELSRAGGVQAQVKDGIWNLRVNGIPFEGVADSELAKIVLGGHSASDAYWKSDLFPLPLWIWGLDAA